MTEICIINIHMMKKTITFTIAMALSLSFYAQESTITPIKTEGKVGYSILVLYQTTNHWLTLSREKRTSFFGEKIAPIMQKFEDKLSIKLFDSEAFHAKTSDYMIIECHDIKDYYYFMEYLRDTELFTKPLIVLNDVIIGIKNGFQDFEKNEYYKK